ncbi:MarC family protein [Pseudoroseomonas ludipueritiae]|uniref:UPF0056 membrane protein n=1 Tax=Pseudoroseomonas ludipueritiae TaxID=198093 RepID=A0ABR7R1R1_9PROT|nr:MarC family protein [Pseudoroseomonas ludipueritiae]MBC9175672.1 MarC family protein [Pseudoroseomonas ludipueritiae]
MDGFLLARVLGEWLFGVSTLVSIINPAGTAFVFQAATSGLAKPERRQLARIVSRNSFVLLLASMLLGARLLAFFGISLEALRIAGGAVVVMTGWQMLVAEPAEPAEAVEPSTRTSALRQAFFPLTMPLTTGPGSIAAAIALSASAAQDNSEHRLLAAALVAFLIAAAVAMLVWICYRHADTLANWLGSNGTLVATKLSAFLLVCVGVQIALNGIEAVLTRIVGNAA